MSEKPEANIEIQGVGGCVIAIVIFAVIALCCGGFFGLITKGYHLVAGGGQ